MIYVHIILFKLSLKVTVLGSGSVKTNINSNSKVLTKITFSINPVSLLFWDGK